MNLNGDDSICYEKIFYDKREIYINDNYDKEQQKATLLHEIIHGLDDEYSIDLSEEQVIRLGNGLYGIIKDNPTLFQ